MTPCLLLYLLKKRGTEGLKAERVQTGVSKDCILLRRNNRLSFVVDMFEGRNVATYDIVGTYFHTEMTEKEHIIIRKKWWIC